jgi:hypothetical protein
MLGDIMQALGDRFPGIEMGEPKDGETTMVLLIPHLSNDLVAFDDAVDEAATAVTTFVETIPIVAEQEAPTDDTKYVIVNGWLCENVNEHTCGTGPDGHYGQHEPGCGLIPLGMVDELLLRPNPSHVRADRDDQWVTMLRASNQIASGLLTTLDLIAAGKHDTDDLLSWSVSAWNSPDDTEGEKK